MPSNYRKIHIPNSLAPCRINLYDPCVLATQMSAARKHEFNVLTKTKLLVTISRVMKDLAQINHLVRSYELLYSIYLGSVSKTDNMLELFVTDFKP